MLLRNNRIKTAFSIFILSIYCISLTPSLIYHDHEGYHHHDHEHIDIDICGHNHAISHTYADCLHDYHYENIPEDCFLCNHLLVVDHISNISNIEYKDIYILDIDCQLSENLCLDKFNIFRNKSPPRII